MSFRRERLSAALMMGELMAERPFTVGSASILNVPTRHLLDLVGDRLVDIIVVPITRLDADEQFAQSSAFLNESGLFLGVQNRSREVSFYIREANDDDGTRVASRIVSKSRGALRSENGAGAIRPDPLGEILSVHPDAQSMVGLTSCGGALVGAALGQGIHLVCTEPDRGDFIRAVSNIGSALNYDALDRLARRDGGELPAADSEEGRSP